MECLVFLKKEAFSSFDPIGKCRDSVCFPGTLSKPKECLKDHPIDLRLTTKAIHAGSDQASIDWNPIWVNLVIYIS